MLGTEPPDSGYRIQDTGYRRCSPKLNSRVISYCTSSRYDNLISIIVPHIQGWREVKGQNSEDSEVRRELGHLAKQSLHMYVSSAKCKPLQDISESWSGSVGEPWEGIINITMRCHVCPTDDRWLLFRLWNCCWTPESDPWISRTCLSSFGSTRHAQNMHKDMWFVRRFNFVGI